MSNLYRREPAVIIGSLLGLIAAGLTAASQATTNGRVDWLVAVAAFLPVATGAIVRSGVFSPKSVAELEAELKAALEAARTVNVTVNNAGLEAGAKVVDEVLAAIDDAQANVNPLERDELDGKIGGS